MLVVTLEKRLKEGTSEELPPAEWYLGISTGHFPGSNWADVAQPTVEGIILTKVVLSCLRKLAKRGSQANSEQHYSVISASSACLGFLPLFPFMTGCNL